MNLLELCLSPGYGGLELYALKVSQYFSGQGVNCRIMVRKGSFLDEKLVESRLSHDTLAVVNRSFPIISSLKLAAYIDKHDIDTVHIHWRGDVTLAVLAKVVSRRKPRLVYTRQMALTRSKHDPFHRFIYRNIDKLLMITEKLRQDALEYLPMDAERIEVLYYGVDKPAAPSMDSCKALMKVYLEKSFSVALFGRIEEGKGQHILVEAVDSLKEKGLVINVAIFGHIMDKLYFSELQDRIKHRGLASNIHYFGMHPDPQSIMGCFDAVVLTSKCETFGLVLIEAMRSGCAVVGTDCGGVPEIIEHEKTGLLVPPGDPVSLADALEKLIVDKSYKQHLATEGKKYADNMFSKEKHFEKLETILLQA